MDEEAQAAAKRHAGRSAAEAVDDGTVVGLGTGSTAAEAISVLGQRVDAGLDITGVPTSYQARTRAREAGVPLTDLGEREHVDIAIDGADQIDDGVAIKGGGAAHTREKIVADAASDVHLVVDETKLTETLDHPVPVAVIPAARSTVSAAIRALGGEPTLRPAARKDGPVVTDEGNLVLDCEFGSITEPGRLGQSLSGIPGVVEHGLFVDLADVIHVGRSEGVAIRTL
jgi:ribose 5-phosphate isomerase A